MFLSCEQLQRGRIGCITTENGLIDVDAYPYDAVGDVLPLQITFNQSATDFLRTYIDIVGPLHFHALHILRKGLLNRHSRTL